MNMKTFLIVSAILFVVLIIGGSVYFEYKERTQDTMSPVSVDTPPLGSLPRETNDRLVVDCKEEFQRGVNASLQCIMLHDLELSFKGEVMTWGERADIVRSRLQKEFLSPLTDFHEDSTYRTEGGLIITSDTFK